MKYPALCKVSEYRRKSKINCTVWISLRDFNHIGRNSDVFCIDPGCQSDPGDRAGFMVQQGCRVGTHRERGGTRVHHNRSLWINAYVCSRIRLTERDPPSVPSTEGGSLSNLSAIGPGKSGCHDDVQARVMRHMTCRLSQMAPEAICSRHQ